MKRLLFVATLLIGTPALAAEDLTVPPPAVTAPAAIAAPSPAAAKKWTVMQEKSSITFRAKQMGTEFEGAITRFTPDIAFDPDHLDASKVTVDIDVASIDAKDPERNKALKDRDWFDPASFPTARFETSKFTKTGENSYLADATLTIKGMAVPVQLPFTLEKQAVGFGQDRTIMTGSVTLDRSKFQLGQGDWADPSVIANEVEVAIKVTATPDGGSDGGPAPGTAPRYPTNP
jgi:polyisoprenoid-binding protein YceI